MALRIDGARLLDENNANWTANDPRGEIFQGDALTINPEGGVRGAVVGDRVIGQAANRGPNTNQISITILGEASFIADGSIAKGKPLVPSAVAGRVKQAGNSPQDRAAICGLSTMSAADGETFQGTRI